MLYLNINNHANNVEPNTTLEGIGSIITSPYELAQRLGVNVNRIAAFKINSVGTITCRIKGSYELKKDAFYNDTYLKSFIDSEGLVLGFGANVFRSSMVERVYTPNATYALGLSEADSGAFRLANRMTECVHSIRYMGLATFQGNTSMGYMDVSNIESISSTPTTQIWAYNFRSSTAIFSSFSSLIIFYNYQTFTLNTANTIWDFPVLEQILGSRYDPFVGNTAATEYRFPVLHTAHIAQGFQNNTQLRRLEFPALINLREASNAESNLGTTGIIRGSGVREFIANAIVDLDCYALFNKAPFLELVEMKKCKRFGKYVNGNDTNFFNESSVGVQLTIRVHEANLKVDNGDVNKILLQAKNSGAIVEFYDDFGNLRSTL